jgi:phosphohistidine phosphatase
MGARLHDKKIMPDIILSSPAVRAKTTAETIAKKIGFEKEIVFKKDIYEASATTLHKILTKIADKKNTVFLFGHNPSLNELAENYIHFNENIPTCGIVEIEFNCNSWADIRSENARLVSFDYPRTHYSNFLQTF